MNPIKETETHRIYTESFQGIPVRFIQDKATGGIMISAEDVANCLGFATLNEMLVAKPDCADVFLDAMNRGDVKSVEF